MIKLVNTGAVAGETSGGREITEMIKCRNLAFRGPFDNAVPSWIEERIGCEEQRSDLLLRQARKRCLKLRIAAAP